MSPPWMPLYVADYLADTAHLSTVEHGAYLLLIMTYWRKGGLPDDDYQLARIVRLTTEEWFNVRSTVVQLFSDGWKHKRIEYELERTTDRSNKAVMAGKRSALARLSQRSLNGRSTEAPTEAQLSQSQSHKSKEAIASSSTVVDLKAAKVESDQKLLDRITDIWNAWAASHGSSQVRYLTGQRSIHCRRRINDLLCGAPIEEAEEAFSRLLSACEQSFFVRGNPRSPLKFDQLMNEGFMVKMMEGSFTHVPERKNTWRA